LIYASGYAHNKDMQTKKLLLKNNESGQIALLVLLVLTIALTVGLSVVSRTITEIRVATDTERSSQAYAAAEAGIERALSAQLQVGDEGNLDLSAGNASYKITQLSSQNSDGSAFGFPTPINKDEATQLWLFDYTDFIDGNLSGFFMEGRTSHTIRAYWGNPSKLSPTNDSTWPALEVTFITADVSGNSLSNFNIEKYAFDPSTRKTQNNFIFGGGGLTASSDPTNGFPVTVSNLNQTKQLSFLHDIPLTRSGSKQYLLMRTKLLYNNTAAHDVVIDPNGASLPAQGRIIDSEGRSENVIRKLRVYQSYPTLPGIFDFVLFNGSDNPLTK
jgi:hypothetical protein